MRITKLLIIILFLLSPANSTGYNNYDHQGTEYLAFAEQMPKPVGGLQAIYELIEYPEFAKGHGIEGKVFVLAFINEYGGVDDVKLVRGIGGGCDEAAIEAIKRSKFTSGMSAGKPAKIKLSLQIQFKLS